MIDIQDLQLKLSNMLNGKDQPNAINISDYVSGFEFKVLTYASYLDSISNFNTLKNFLPVYISDPQGTVEPIPYLQETNSQYTITIFFPLKYKEELNKLNEYFVDSFAGRMLNFSKSGNALCGLNLPTFGEVQDLEFKQFKDWIGEYYQMNVLQTDKWCSYSFVLYFHQLKGLGEKGGFILGNQFEYTLSFKYGNQTYSEKVDLASAARNYTADPMSEQILGDLETLSLNKNSIYADSVCVYVKDTDFWNTFNDLYELGKLQDTIFTLTKKYLYNGKSYERELILTSCPQNIALGVVMTYTLTYFKKASV